jgi:hypothetical protein
MKTNLSKLEIFWQKHCLTENRKAYLLKSIQKIRDEHPEKSDHEKVRFLMRSLWTSYDLGGISVGRSLRSVILEQATECFDFNLMEESKYLVSLLICMYHNPSYINRNGWYDFTVSVENMPVGEVSILVSIGTFFNLEDIPDISECEAEKIFSFVNKCSDAIRVLRVE